MSETIELSARHCKPCEGGVPPMPKAEAEAMLSRVPEWQMSGDATEIRRLFRFKNYHQVIAFVNAIAWIAHREDHHPDLEVGFGQVAVRYTTHAVGGLSENDFICAAKVDRLLA